MAPGTAARNEVQGCGLGVGSGLHFVRDMRPSTPKSPRGGSSGYGVVTPKSPSKKLLQKAEKTTITAAKLKAASDLLLRAGAPRLAAVCGWTPQDAAGRWTAEESSGVPHLEVQMPYPQLEVNVPYPDLRNVPYQQQQPYAPYQPPPPSPGYTVHSVASPAPPTTGRASARSPGRPRSPPKEAVWDPQGVQPTMVTYGDLRLRQLLARAEGAEQVSSDLRAENKALDADMQAKLKEIETLQDASRAMERRLKGEIETLSAEIESSRTELEATQAQCLRDVEIARRELKAAEASAAETHAKAMSVVEARHQSERERQAEAAASAARAASEFRRTAELTQAALEQAVDAVRSEKAEVQDGWAATAAALESTRAELENTRATLGASEREAKRQQDLVRRGAEANEEAAARHRAILEDLEMQLREAHEANMRKDELVAAAREETRRAAAQVVAEAAGRREERERADELVRRRQEDAARAEATQAEDRARAAHALDEERRRREADGQRAEKALSDLRERYEQSQRQNADAAATHAAALTNLKQAAAMEKQLLHDEMRRSEQRSDALGRQIDDLRAEMQSQSAQHESELLAQQLERRGRQEVERRSTQLEEVLKHEGDTFKGRCMQLEMQLDEAHSTIRTLQERLAAMYSERMMESAGLQRTIEVLHVERRGMEEVVRVLKSETETMRAHAARADDRCVELERLREELLAALDSERKERKEASSTLTSERRRAEMAEQARNKLQTELGEGRRLMSEHSQASRMMQRGLEAQISSLRHDRRQQVIGYCSELSKWA